MKKKIWVICSDKQILAATQRRINEGGSMMAICLMSYAATEKAVERLVSDGVKDNRPSLILADFDSEISSNFSCLSFLEIQPAFAGTPLFFMCQDKTEETEEQCYNLGATGVFQKPLTDAVIKRIEHVAWQHEMTKNYEKLIKKQSDELESAKEIKRLNGLLKSRNEVLRQIFGKYFSEDVLTEILDNQNGARLGGEKKQATVLMADLRGFTSLSDSLSGDTVVDMLDRFLDSMIGIIINHRGTVIEIIGDGILAVFGAPVPSDKPVCDALAAAIEMQNAMQEVNEYNKSKEYPSIEMGIGIHSGEVFIGNIGSEYMMRYNVIGQAVNLCSRIESYTFGGQILISRDSIKGYENFCSAGAPFWISVKGMRKQVPICEVDRVYIEGDRTYILEKEISLPMKILNNTPRVMLYIIQDKFIGTFSIYAKALEISDKKILIELDNEDVSAIGIYSDVELLIEGKNAYAKVIKVNENKLMLRFTYMSEYFYEAFFGDNTI